LKKGILILTLIILVLFTASSVCASDVNDTQVAGEEAAAIEISQSDDNQAAEQDDETLSEENDFDALSANIGTYSDLSNEIGSGGNKNLTHSYYKYDGSSMTISITAAGVIDGKGAVIDMAGSSIRVFNVGTSGVTIKNLTIENVNFNSRGGAICFDNNGTVENCNFVNSIGSYGGALYFNSEGTVTNCNFTDNLASEEGGAIYFRYGSTGTLENCNFINNRATGYYGYGGAIYMYLGTVENCNFINNNATGDYGCGGAIYTYSGTVENCNFVDNQAYDGGGAVCFNSNGEVTNCNFTNNTVRYSGGAVYFKSNSNDANVTNCNFTNNQATWGDGGAIRMNYGNVLNCNFVDNNAYDDGGAIHISRGNVTLCNFTNNSATYDGGAILCNNLFEVTSDTCIFKTVSDTTYHTLNLPPTLNVDNSRTVYYSGEKLTFELKTASGMPIYNRYISISVYYKNNDSWFGDYSCLSGEGWTMDLPDGSYNLIFNTEYAKFKPIIRTINIISNIRYYVSVSPLTTDSMTVNITAKSNIPNDIIKGELLFILPNSEAISANYNSDGIWWALYTFDDYGAYSVNAHYTGINGVAINKAIINVKGTVEKTTPKITAKSKTFKAKTKTKKYTIALKNNAGIPIQKNKLTLKVKGKTYKATTNSKGKATFKITKLAKKGTYSAVINYKGNSNYNKVTKKVKIKVK
jgi:predicted outer membrane repeat protein